MSAYIESDSTRDFAKKCGLDVIKVTGWETPSGNDARILTMPNVPDPLHCVPGDSEVLTHNGWRCIAECEVGDDILCWKDGVVSFSPILSTVKSKCDYAYKIGFSRAKNFDMIYSPEHRIPIQYTERYRGRRKTKMAEPKKYTYVRTAEEFRPNNNAQLYTAARSGMESRAMTAVDRICVAIQADGSLKHRLIGGGYSYCVRLLKKRKIDRLQALLDESKLTYTRRVERSSGCTSFVIRVPMESKTLSNRFSYEMSYEMARDFINELTMWDGYNDGKRRYYCSTRRDNIDFAQAIAFMAGYTTTLETYVGSGTQKTSYTLWFFDKETRGCGKLQKEKIEWKNNMYCVTVDSSFFVMRQHDSTIVTGNCLAPRTILGSKSWNQMRNYCYKNANDTCEVCGYKPEDKRHRHAHELYRYDYTKGEAVFERVICLCYTCHVLGIHSGRALTMFKQGNPMMSKEAILTGAEHLFKQLHEYNVAHPEEEPLRAFITFVDYARWEPLQKEMLELFEKYDVKFYEPDSRVLPADWSQWHLVIGSKSHYSKFANRKEWAEAMAKNNKTNQRAAVEKTTPIQKEVDEIIKSMLT